MSKESFIGGDYIETTGGDTKVFSDESIFNSSATKFIQNGGDGVFYGINKPAPIIGSQIDASCIVEFRPRLPNYGKFGFDFMRIGDNTGSGVYDVSYLGNMGTHAQNKSDGIFTPEVIPYNKFKGYISDQFNR